MRVLIALLAVAAVGAVGWSLRLSRRLRHSERDRRRSADELNRRLSELFSLQELSFILSGSLQLDRIVEQVVRYAMRFLDAQGALVALTLDGEAAGEPGQDARIAPYCRSPPPTVRWRRWRVAPSGRTIPVWSCGRWAASGSSWCAARVGNRRGWWRTCRPTPRRRSRCAPTAWWWEPW